MTDLLPAEAAEWEPNRETRWKLGRFIELLAEGATITAAAEEIEMTRMTIWRIRKRYPPFDDAWTKVELERKAIIGADVRQALLDKALKDGNTHAIIHADRLYNKQDYQPAEKTTAATGNGLTINIMVPQPPRPSEIPEGDPTGIIEIAPPPAALPPGLEDDEDDEGIWDLEEDE